MGRFKKSLIGIGVFLCVIGLTGSIANAEDSGFLKLESSKSNNGFIWLVGKAGVVPVYGSGLSCYFGKSSVEVGMKDFKPDQLIISSDYFLDNTSAYVSKFTNGDMIYAHKGNYAYPVILTVDSCEDARFYSFANNAVLALSKPGIKNDGGRDIEGDNYTKFKNSIFFYEFSKQGANYDLPAIWEENQQILANTINNIGLSRVPATGAGEQGLKSNSPEIVLKGIKTENEQLAVGSSVFVARAYDNYFVNAVYFLIGSLNFLLFIYSVLLVTSYIVYRTTGVYLFFNLLTGNRLDITSKKTSRRFMWGVITVVVFTGLMVAGVAPTLIISLISLINTIMHYLLDGILKTAWNIITNKLGG